MALADSGDSLDDANFSTTSADAIILRLHTLVEWCKEMVDHKDKMSTASIVSFAERLFDAQIDQAIFLSAKAYGKMKYKDVLKEGFFDMLNARDVYRATLSGEYDCNWNLIHRFIETIVIVMAPISSHISEYIWQNILGNTTSVFKQHFPAPNTKDAPILKVKSYLDGVAAGFTKKLAQFNKKNKNLVTPTATITVNPDYPAWVLHVVQTLKKAYEENKHELPDVKYFSNLFKSDPLTSPKLKQVMTYVASFSNKIQEEGSDAFVLVLPFDEVQVLKDHVDLFKSTLNIHKIDVVTGTGSSEKQETTPGKPYIYFR